MKDERIINGIRCGEVLEVLSDFVDSSLSEQRVQQISAHVAECRQCERFGSDFSSALEALQSLGKAPPLDDAIAARLRLAIAEE